MRPTCCPPPIPARAIYAGNLPAPGALRLSEEERVLERFLEVVTKDYIPLAVIVNAQLEVMHVLGDTGGYFRLPSGKVVNDISKMAVRELAIPLTTGIQKVFRQRQELRFANIRLPQEGVSVWLICESARCRRKKG
jgi:hypothetical protein